MRIKFFVSPIGDHWEVASTLRGHPQGRHRDRASALQHAQADAQQLWKQQRIASEVLVDEDDGHWHSVAHFGELLDRDEGPGGR